MENVIIKPWVTERATDLQTIGQYAFLVAPGATKNEIRKAVQMLYSVHVTDVTVMNRLGKMKRFRATRSRRAGHRRAIVTLKAGEKIDIGI